MVASDSATRTSPASSSRSDCHSGPRSPSTDSTGSEAGQPFGHLRRRLDLGADGARRSLPTPARQLLDRVLRTFGDHFHAAVAQVAGVAAHPEAVGFVLA